MARYIEANELVRKMTLQANRTMLGEIAPPHLSYSEMLEIIADAPTADVAPKGEVERLREINNSLLEAGQEWQKRYESLAREIFELIEDECLAYPIQDGHPTILVDARNYNELKKEYTEGE